MELDLNNFLLTKTECIVVKCLSTCCNLTSLSEATAAFSHWVRAWSESQKSARGLEKARAIPHSLFRFHE